MTEHEEHQLHESLKSWQVNLEKDPDFKHNVHHRIHEQFFSENASAPNNRGALSWLLKSISNPLYASAVTVMFLIATTFLSLHYRKGPSSEQELLSQIPDSYQAVLDPAQTARMMVAENKPGFETLSETPALSRESFEQALFWIEEQVKLDKPQKVSFQKIHESFFTKYELLCSQLIQLENKYRQFERDRIAGDPIDLFSVYANFQQQKSIYLQTIQLQQELIQEVSTLLTPQQQGAYGQLFHQLPQHPESTPPSANLESPTREWQI